MINRYVSRHGKLYKFISLIDSVRNLTLNHFLAIETIHGNLGIGRNDNAVCILNLLLCKHILGSARTSCLNFHKTVLRLGSLLNSFCCHVGVGNSCRAGSNSQNLKLIRFSLSHIGQTLIYALLLLICLINDRKKFLWCLRCTKALGKVLIHQHHGKLAEHIQMNIILCIWRSNKKQQGNRLSVKRVKVNPSRDHHSGKSWFLYCITFTMRNGNSLPDSCSTFFLSGIDLLTVRFLIINLATSGHKGNRCIQSLRLICWGSI